MNHQQLLNRIETQWMAFQNAYADLPESQLLVPGVVGDWSIKDLIAHITIWEEEALKYVPLLLSGRKPPRYSVTYGGIDAFNAQTIAQWRTLSLSEVLRRHRATHAELLELVRQLPQEQIARETSVRRRLRLDTYSHYPLHTAAILAWRHHQTILPAFTELDK